MECQIRHETKKSNFDTQWTVILPVEKYRHLYVFLHNYMCVGYILC